MTKELSILTQDFGQAFDMMKKGPNEFIQAWMDIGTASEKQGKLVGVRLDCIRSRLAKATSPAIAARLVNLMKGGPEAVEKYRKALATMPDSIAKVSATFRSDRTPQEYMDLYEQQFVIRFRKLTGGTSDMLKRTREAFGEASDKIRLMAAGDGPMAGFINKMSEMHKFGVSALLPEALRPMGVVFGTMVKNITPLIANLETLGLTSLGLMTPFKVLAGALLGTTMLIKSNEIAIGKKLLPAEVKRIKVLDKLEKKGKLGPKGRARRERLLHKIAMMGAKHHGEALDMTTKQIVEWTRDATKTLTKWVKAAPAIFKDLAKIYDEINKVFVEAWPDIWKEVEPQLKDLKKKIIEYSDDFIAGFKHGWDPVTNPGGKKGLATSLGKMLGDAAEAGVDFAVLRLPFIVERFVFAMGAALQKALIGGTVYEAALFGYFGGGVKGAFKARSEFFEHRRNKKARQEAVAVRGREEAQDAMRRRNWEKSERGMTPAGAGLPVLGKPVGLLAKPTAPISPKPRPTAQPSMMETIREARRLRITVEEMIELQKEGNGHQAQTAGATAATVDQLSKRPGGAGIGAAPRRTEGGKADVRSTTTAGGVPTFERPRTLPSLLY